MRSTSVLLGKVLKPDLHLWGNYKHKHNIPRKESERYKVGTTGMTSLFHQNEDLVYSFIFPFVI